MNADAPLPLECLTEEEIALIGVHCEAEGYIPPWMTKQECIADVERNIAQLKSHITKYGNTWQTEYE